MTRLEFEAKKINNGVTKLAASIDKTEPTIRNYFSRSTVPPLDVAKSICDYFAGQGIDIPVADLLEDVNEEGIAIKESLPC